MTGLIWKDFLVLRKTFKSYAILIALYGAMAAMGMFSFSFVAGFLCVMVMLLPVSAFAYDEQARWDKYALSLPLGRRAVVGARYLFAVLLFLIAAALGLVFCAVFASGGRAEAVAGLFGSMGAGLFIADVTLPLNYKLGPERARPFFYAAVLLPMVLLFGAFKLGLHLDLRWIDELPDAALALFALIPLAALAGLGLSYLVSCRIVERKEF